MTRLAPRRSRNTVRVCWRLLLVLSIAAAVHVRAQPDTGRWILAQCLECALASSPDVHAAVADVQIAESKLARAKAGRLPQAKFTALLSAMARLSQAVGQEVTTLQYRR